MRGKQLLALSAALLMSGSPLMRTQIMAEETTVQTDDQQALIRLQKAQAQYDLGSAGFFKELADKGSADAQYAYELITMNSSNYTQYQNGTNKDIDISGYTHLGKEGDATNLENMKTAVELLPLTNQYRQKENETEKTSLKNCMVTSSLMALCQLDTNRSQDIIGHSGAFMIGANLSWGSPNPFSGWYETEKPRYQAGEREWGKIGHYVNVVNPDYEYMGMARAASKGYGFVSGLTLAASWMKLYVNEAVSVEEYTAKFNEYYNRVTTELREAKQACGTLQPVEMQRMYNPNSGEHFYTADPAERDFLVAAGWKHEGTGWKAPKESSTPVYRLYNPNAGDHHYTTDNAERSALLAVGWKDEGIGWYSDDSQGIPLYRQYNPNAVAGSHNYTTSQEENSYLVSIGWNEEGIAWYGLK